MTTEIEGYKFIGQGYGVVPVGRREGIAVNIRQPNEMIKLLTNPERVKNSVVVTPGGTTTFVAPLLYKKPAGIITYAGTPESHLGIVGRNFNIAIVMTLKLEGINAIPDGTPLLLLCEGKLGRVYAKLEAGVKSPQSAGGSTPGDGSILGDGSVLG